MLQRRLAAPGEAQDEPPPQYRAAPKPFVVIRFVFSSGADVDDLHSMHYTKDIFDFMLRYSQMLRGSNDQC